MAVSPASRPASADGARLALLTYCLLLVGLPLVAIPAMIALGRTDFFLHHGASVWVQANDSIFAMHDRQCDVLVFGDSTAMTGIDPAQVQATTGMRTCNIAVTNAVLAVTDDLALQHFLAHNARPRVLLLQFSPDDLQRESHIWTRTIYAEGLLELLRHSSGHETRKTFLKHPRETIAFAGYIAGYSAYYGLRSLWSFLTFTQMRERTVVVHNGFFTPPTATLTNCEFSERRVDLSDREFAASFVSALRERYMKRAGTVLIDVAPIPACDANLAAYQTQLSGTTSNELRGLPMDLFNDQRHYTAAGAQVVSAEISAQIKATHH